MILSKILLTAPPRMTPNKIMDCFVLKNVFLKTKKNKISKTIKKLFKNPKNNPMYGKRNRITKKGESRFLSHYWQMKGSPQGI